MNSYPLELLAQLAPVMFVAGLNPPASPPPPPTASNPGPTHPAPTHHSHHPSSSNNDPNLPTSRSHTSLPSNTHSATPSARPDPFTILFARLREVMLNQRKVTVWDPPTFPTNALDNDGRPVHEKKKIFQVVLVDKDIRFPPRKVDPEPASQADVPAAFSTGHSPLSPLTLTSPLHPDGLIAPIWIRKHTMLVPAVFVLFTRLFELDSTNTPASPPDALELERQQDTMLSSAIAQRKRTTNERGIKLTVVLLASRRMLDDPSLNLDARLTFIRRQSGLDSRAALFVLSPIAKDELSDFVKSLQTALWDPAVEYYTAHSKRVRQKRNRYQAQASQQTSHYNPISTLGPAPLSPKGWTVRYEYKMACFAEFRGEHEVALKHYQDAYTALTMMFLAPGSSLSAGAAISPGEKGLISATSTPSHLAAQFSLPPRTKRWAEAKVLADTINIKIIKLYLYNNETALALAQQRLHVRTFPTVAGFVGSPTAGEGKEGEEGSYEYWSWVSRMWSVLAEMLVEGSRTPGSDLIIPVHRPRLPLSGPGASSTTTGSIVGRKSTLAEGFLGGTGVGGINPSHALMHPGWYYLFAAECAEKKTARFIQGSRAREGEMSQEQRKTYLGSVKGLVGDVLELYTKSYELFKVYNSQSPPSSSLTRSMSNPAALSVSMSNPSAQSLASSGNTGAGRLPLYIAHRIALTYTLFPNLTFTLSDSSSPVDGMDELDPEVWQTGGEGGEDDGEVKALRGKDPEKLALASRFLARITKGYQREGAFASSTHSPTTSPSFPKLISSFPPSRNGGLVLAASNPDSNEGVFLQWGWHSLLLPLLRTWSGILRFLIGNELRVVREIDVGDEKREKERREAYTRAEDHLESYIRVLVERISVDAVSVDKNPHLQRELIRGLTTWSLVGHQRRKFTTAEATDVVDGDGDRDQEGKVIRMDHTEIQPIFDTYVVFWRGKIWISDSGSLSSAEETTFSFSSLKVDESTPFQFSITSPSYVDIDELVWSEVRLGLVFEYESYETEARSEEEDSTEGAHAPEEGGSKVQTRVRDAVIVIRSTQKQPVPPTEPQDEGNHLVSCINIGDINFGGSNFDSGKRVIEREVETDMLLRWRLGETKVFTGSVGVVEGSGIGEGRVTISSLVLRLGSPVSSGLAPGALELPLNISARRGAPPPPLSIPDSLTVSTSATSNGGKVQSQVQELWFAGYIEAKPRWIPVSRQGSDVGGGNEYVEVQHRPHPVLVSVHHSGPAYVGEEYPVEIVIRGCPCRDADIQGALKERDYSKEEIVDVVMDVLLQPVETDVTAAVNTIFIDTYQSNAMIKGIPLGSLALHPHSTSKSPAEIKRTLWIKNTGGAGDRVVDMGVRTNLVGDENSAANPRLETETLETISIPCTEPLKVSYDIEYRRRAPPGPSVGFAEGSGKPWWLFDSMEGDGEDEDESVSTWAERAEADTEAIVRMTLECMGSSGVQVEKVRLKSKKNSKNVRIFSSEVDLEDKEAADMFPLELLPRDEFCDICRIGISNLNEDDDKDDEEIPSPGEYEILWRRILPSGEHGPLSSTLLPLPSLHPPPDELVALLDVPPSAKLHEPIPLTLTVRNCHPSRTAAVYVQLEASSSANVNDASTTGASVQAQISDVSSAGSPGFIVAGLRSGRVPLLLAGAEERLTWMLIPIECGNVKLPTIRVFDRRKGSKGGLGALVGAGSEEADINEGIRNSMDIEGQGREVKVVDVRVERRRGRVIPIDGQGRGPALEEVQRIGTVLVLP